MVRPVTTEEQLLVQIVDGLGEINKNLDRLIKAVAPAKPVTSKSSKTKTISDVKTQPPIER